MDSVTWPERTLLPQYCYLASDVPPSSSIFLPQKTLPPPCCYLRELVSLNSPSSMLLPQRTLFYPWVTLLQWTLTPPCCYQASEFLPPPCCYLVQTFLPPPPICCLRKLSPHHVVTSENSPSSMCYLAQWTLPPPCCYLASENSPSYMLPKRTLPHTFFLRELSLFHVLPCFRELSLFHALADVPVNKSSLGIHQIELVVQPSSQDFDYKNKIMFIVVSRQFCVTSSV